MRKFGSAAGLLLLLPFALLAQDTPKAELFTGVSYLRINKANYLGWNVALDGNINKNLGLVVDGRGVYGSQTTSIGGITTDNKTSIHALMVGPRVSDPRGRWNPFAQALFGWGRVHQDQHASSGSTTFPSSVTNNNAFAAALGGGIDYKLAESANIRIIQVEYMMLHYTGLTQQGAQIGAGLDLRFGRKRQ